jgi:hypothetical protein
MAGSARCTVGVGRVEVLAQSSALPVEAVIFHLLGVFSLLELAISLLLVLLGLFLLVESGFQEEFIAGPVEQLCSLGNVTDRDFRLHY